MICPQPRQLCQLLACWLCWAEQSLFPLKLLIVNQDICDYLAPGSKKQGRDPSSSSRTGQKCNDSTAGSSLLLVTVAQTHLYSLPDKRDYLGPNLHSRRFCRILLLSMHIPITLSKLCKVMDLKMISNFYPGHKNLIPKIWILFLKLPLLHSLISFFFVASSNEMALLCTAL